MYPDRPEILTRIGIRASPVNKKALKRLLIEHIDVFAWSHKEMSGKDQDVIKDHLSVDPAHRPVHQKRRSFSVEKYDMINEEVEKLLTISFIKEAHYPE